MLLRAEAATPSRLSRIKPRGIKRQAFLRLKDFDDTIFYSKGSHDQKGADLNFRKSNSKSNLSIRKSNRPPDDKCQTRMAQLIFY
jgi:hypothetical protein